MDEQAAPTPRRMVKGPKGQWSVSPAAESVEERQRHQDRIALANHLTGFVPKKLKLS